MSIKNKDYNFVSRRKDGNRNGSVFSLAMNALSKLLWLVESFYG